jgi:4-hydroxyphenylpyruvate dioxygenase
MQFTPWDNPMGTDGFEFIEYAAPDPVAMGALFERMGFKAIAKHRHKNVLLYRQGEINFIVNAEPDSFAQRFARLHGPSICAIAFRVQDAKAAYERAVGLGAWGYAGQAGPGELNIPAIKGIGDSLIYLVDRWRGKNGAKEGEIGNIGFFDVDFEPLPGQTGASLSPPGHGLTYIDHLTHNVHRGRMTEWADFYERLFNFREVRYFDIEGQVTGVKSKAMTSPCGKIRIPINEEGNEKAGQIQEYLDKYHGEGIQHIALGSTDLFRTVDALRNDGVKLLDTIDTYYELVDKRIPGHGEDVAALKQRKILIDGKAGELLLQIFSENQLGPIFFEFIQRKGDQGFGEGNFKALFESIELDQMRRGVLEAKAPA